MLSVTLLLFLRSFIGAAEMEKAIARLGKSNYADYLRRVLSEA